MSDSDRAAFLAGDRPEDVFIYLDDAAVSNPDALETHGEPVDGGIVLVLPGDTARNVFQQAAGIDPMAFAKQAMGTDGTIDADCTGGTCPDSEDGGEGEGTDHDARFVFAFAEEQNEEVGDIYAEGDVIHAYVSCACGTAYSDKWVAGER
jgi:hypothetical protein